MQNRTVALLVLPALLFPLLRQGVETRGGGLHTAAGPSSLPCDVRTPIDALNTPGDADSTFKITAPGSYYLTANLTGASGKHGIEVESAGDVTIDLCGFTLTGVAGSLDGLTSAASTVVTNGSARGWGGRGFAVSQGNLDRLAANGNGGDGFRALWGSVITNCTAEANGGDGISVGDVSRIEGCVSKGNQGHGIQLDGACILADCVVYNNDDGGILGGLATIRDNKLFSNSGSSIEVSGFAVVTGNLVTSASTGILATGDRNRIAGNTLISCVTAIDVDGVDNLITGNALQGNTTGIDAVAGNALGPVVDVGGVGDVSGTAGAEHPLANLEY